MISTSFAKAAGDEKQELRRLLKDRDDRFWDLLRARTDEAASFGEMIFLSGLRKKASASGFGDPRSSREAALKIALIGGSTLFPLSDIIEHTVSVTSGVVSIHSGDFNNYRSEIDDPDSALYDFGPDIVFVIPDDSTCRYTGRLTDGPERVAEQIESAAHHNLELCRLMRDRTGAEIIFCNFLLPPLFDLGQFNTKAPASEWNFRKAVNLSIAASAPNYIHICDLEFLAYRLGGLVAQDERSWFESKQLLSPDLQVAVAKETAHLVSSLKKASKKVLVMDLDNTIWGGVIGDDGMEGIELGDTSPRGEAFKAFQTYILSLTDRGLLLAVSSKNDHENAIEPFQSHPEMVLREEHIVSFKANWEPKVQNIIEMAEELSLGLDSFVFVDDNPAEIEIVNQFAPEVTTILLGPDPAFYVRQLKESRLFERSSITDEDANKTEQYKRESERKLALGSAVDMDSYLESLEMEGVIRDFDRLDLPRIAQLINKSNQFNLTTRRRTESEVERVIDDPDFTGFTMRLSDKFGDHGLISVVIGKRDGDTLEIDTWLMSCRVLKRQVEEEVMNEIVERARLLQCTSVKGLYLATAKNGMVKRHYQDLGFSTVRENEESGEYELSVEGFEPRQTYISVESTARKI